ncbi:cysteine--1-D-myo-inosityl 2-amino-2-deoxy-alpha-D-glucopyranoside ligase, partial [Sphaerisporangium aureirubrum]
RAVAALPGGPVTAAVLALVRERMAADLDAPGALAVVDDWAGRALAGDHADPGAPALVRATVDALLGVAL